MWKTSLVLPPAKLRTAPAPLHNNNQIDPTDQVNQLMNASTGEGMRVSVGERMEVTGRIEREGMTGERKVREAGSQIVGIMIERRREGSAVKETNLRSGRHQRDGTRTDLNVAGLIITIVGILTATARPDGNTALMMMTTTAGRLFRLVVDVNIINFNY